MNDIAQAIADRQSEIDRLQTEIKALTDVEQLLGAPAPRPAARRASPRKATAAPAESQAQVKPQRKRREMTAVKPQRKRREMTTAEKKAVSERMTAYWAERRKKAKK